MSVWAPLLPVVMVGTERHPAPLPPWPGAAGLVAAAAASTAADAPAALLRTASVLTVCTLAGTHGAPWSAPLPAPAPDDRAPSLTDPGAVALMRWAFVEGTPRLHHEVLMWLATTGRRLPALLLPLALDLGRRTAALRAPLSLVLGERGLWLAGQRDEWAFAAGVAEAGTAVWTHGSLEQRQQFLADERRADTAAARDRLMAALDDLPARDRAALAGILADGLSGADEPLLERLRSDRSREVRHAALALLLRLPAAVHPQRAVARLAALLTRDSAGSPASWTITAPDAAGDDWSADQIEVTRPKAEPLGERAWWLYQLVRQAPLAWWTSHLAMTPPALIDWAASSDWHEALLRGWRDVLFAAPDPDWGDAVLERWPAGWRDEPAAVLALLPPPRRERHLLRALADGTAKAHVVVAQAIHACQPGETVSQALSTALVDVCHRCAAEGLLQGDLALRDLLPSLATVVHPDLLERLGEIPRQPGETPTYASTMGTFSQIIALRRTLSALAPSRIP